MGIMAGVAMAVAGLSAWVLYQAAFIERRATGHPPGGQEKLASNAFTVSPPALDRRGFGAGSRGG